MFNKCLNYFKDEEYSVLISENKLYINNYQKVIDIDNEKLKVLTKNKKIYIEGINLVIKRLDKKEIYITGIIKKVDIYDR